MRPGRTTTSMLALATAVLATLSGCSSDDGPASEASPDASGAASSPAATTSSPTASTSSSAAGSEAASALPTPAEGRTVETKSLSFVVPRDFEPQDGVGNGLASVAQLDSVQRGCQVFVSSTVNVQDTTLEEAAALSAKVSGDQRQPDREVGGQPVFVLGSGDQIDSTYTVGRPVGDQTVQLQVACVALGAEAPSASDEQDLVESILATVKWKA